MFLSVAWLSLLHAYNAATIAHIRITSEKVLRAIDHYYRLVFYKEMHTA